MPDKVPRRIFFSGAGGVGKTSVVEPVMNGIRAAGKTAEFMPSVSRDFFKHSGITTEQAGLERPESDRLDFQLALYEFYCKKAIEFSCKAQDKGTDFVFFDRSPFDHLAYCVYNAPNIISGTTLRMILARGREVMLHPYKNLSKDTKWKIVRFPVLTSWLDKGGEGDGMRYAPPGKNYTVDALIDSNIRHAMVGVSMGDYVVRLSPESSISARVTMILENVE